MNVFGSNLLITTVLFKGGHNLDSLYTNSSIRVELLLGNKSANIMPNLITKVYQGFIVPKDQGEMEDTPKLEQARWYPL